MKKGSTGSTTKWLTVHSDGSLAEETQKNRAGSSPDGSLAQVDPHKLAQATDQISKAMKKPWKRTGDPFYYSTDGAVYGTDGPVVVGSYIDPSTTGISGEYCTYVEAGGIVQLRTGRFTRILDSSRSTRRVCLDD